MTTQTWIPRAGLKDLRNEIICKGGKIVSITTVEMGWIEVIAYYSA